MTLTLACLRFRELTPVHLLFRDLATSGVSRLEPSGRDACPSGPAPRTTSCVCSESLIRCADRTGLRQWRQDTRNRSGMAARSNRSGRHVHVRRSVPCRPRKRHDECSDASHALPRGKRPPAYEGGYTLPKPRRAALVNIFGAATWTAERHRRVVVG